MLRHVDTVVTCLLTHDFTRQIRVHTVNLLLAINSDCTLQLYFYLLDKI